MRKFFPRIFGNDGTKERIGTAIAEGRLPHALLIDGGAGSGKLTLAKSIAAALNCENKGKESYSLPCHDCPSCRKIFGDGHVDVRILGLDEGRATIGVGEVKELRADMFLTSTEAEYKVYIIRNAERMTPAAQNALLIVLEEPPRNVVIMLLASGTDKILTTIKSRAQYIPMSRFSREEIRSYLMRHDAGAAIAAREDAEGFSGVLSAADGRLGRAIELISPEMRSTLAEEREEVTSIIESLGRGGGCRDTLAAVTSLPKGRAELGESLERLMSALSDLIRQKYDEEDEPRFFGTREEAARYAAQMTSARLFKIYDLVSEAYDKNTKNANISMLLVALAANMKRA